MTAMASVSSPWMPEDDLLLKNSIETGASLESLAKGAVKFSRKFTFREIRDRWYSLLYDPDVSAQASAHMAELELSGSSNPPSKVNNMKGNEKVPEKRKTGSVRKQYHVWRKRIKNEFFSSQNLGFYEEHNLENKFQDHVTTNHEAPGGDAMLDDCLANSLGFEEKDFEILRQAFPESIGSIATTTTVVANAHANASANPNPFHIEGDLFKFPEDVSPSFDQNIEMKDATCTSETPPNLKTDNKQEANPGFGGKHHFSSPVSDGSASFHTLGFSSPSARLPLWKTLEDVSAPDMPVDDTNQERHQLADETLPQIPQDSDQRTDNKKPNENGFINSSSVHEGEYTDLPDSLLNFSNEDDILFMDVDVKDMQEDIVQEVDVATSSIPTATLAIPSPEESKDLSIHGADLALQLTEGQVICTLNTEDPEIPCNDDIFLLIHPSTPFAPSVGVLEVSRDPIGPLSPLSHEKDGENTLRKGKDPAQCFRSHTGGPEFVSTFKREPPDSEYLVPCQQPINLRNPSQTRPMHAPLEITPNGMLEDNASKDEHQILGSPVLPLEAGPVKIINPESNDDSYISDSDGEIPYFSDVEAVILDMDLTNSQESCLTSEVARYQYEGAKKMIIRLEQAARSSFHRAMSSQRALAIFYGRRLKHYIKKSEVTIGRSTDDTEVDIDLRKEGRANKISRRQAIIKMETDGVFSLKNVGASSISLNGKDVAHGQVVGLSSSCLIEIRGMSFVFEMNEKYVRRYLANQGRVVEEKKV